MSANSMIPGVRRSISAWSIPRKAPASVMLSRPVSSWSKPAPSVSSVDTRPSTAIEPSLGSRIPDEGQQERALAGPVRPDQPDRLAVADLEVQVAQGPEVGGARSGRGAAMPDERALDRRPLGEAQVVADPEAADVDGDGRSSAVAHRIRAKAGSTRLKKRDAEPRRTNGARAPGAERQRSSAGAVVDGLRAPGHRAVGGEEDRERVERHDLLERLVGHLPDGVEGRRDVEQQPDQVGHHVASRRGRRRWPRRA